jgi:hypothetical protein
MRFNTDRVFVDRVLALIRGDHCLSPGERTWTGLVMVLLFVVAYPAVIGLGLASEIPAPWSAIARAVGVLLSAVGLVATIDHITMRIVATDAVIERRSVVRALCWSMPLNAVSAVALRTNRSALSLHLKTADGTRRSLQLTPNLVQALRPFAGA